MALPESLVLTPRVGAQGTVILPGSKSISNRALLLAGLAKGTTVLSGVLDSEDTQVMMACLKALGVVMTATTAGPGHASDLASDAPCPAGGSSLTLRVTGVDGRFAFSSSADSPLSLFVGNSGLTIRTLVPALAASMAGTGGVVDLSGVARMHERPIGDLVDGLRAIGAQIDYLGRKGFPPLRITGAPLATGREISVRGDTSSQFLTGLLQAGPLLARQAAKPVVLAVDGELISQPYIEITLATLKKFGVHIERLGPHRYQIDPQGITSPEEMAVEGDASSASYFLAAGLLGGGPVRVVGAGRSSVQGDVQFAYALEKMGARIRWGEDWIESQSGEPASLAGKRHIKGVTLDCNAIPDAAMTLAVVALFADGPTILRNIGSWRVKETDRISAIAKECEKLGASVQVGPDWIEIRPPSALKPAKIDTYDDHRMAMCFSLASFGSVAVGIRDPGCVAKTYPEYFEVFSDLCARAIPVIAIDGPTASGKGTIASAVAKALGFHYLDSGALYRLLALAAKGAGVDPGDEQALTSVATAMDIRFEGQNIKLSGQDVTDAIRQEDIGAMASQVAAHQAVRKALLLRQRDFARLPGLVADGRDMGSVVFGGARLKIFLTATPEARAQRRYKQLIDKGFSCTLSGLSADLAARDERDASRAVAPLKPASDAQVIDSTGLSIEQVVQAVLNAWRLA